MGRGTQEEIKKKKWLFKGSKCREMNREGVLVSYAKYSKSSSRSRTEIGHSEPHRNPKTSEQAHVEMNTAALPNLITLTTLSIYVSLA